MDDTRKATTTESSIEDSAHSIPTPNILDYNVDSNETAEVVDQILCLQPNILPITLPSTSPETEILNDQYHNNSESSSSSLIPRESPSSSSTSITLQTQIPTDLASTSTSNSTPVQHPIFALPMHQQNPSQVIIPPINNQSPAFMIPLPTIYVPIIPLNPWQMATLKSRVKHQLKLKRKASSSSCSSISHRLKISRKKIHKRARLSTSQDLTGGDQKKNQEQENSTCSYFQENENDDEFLVVVDVDMSEDDDDEDSTDDEDENENGHELEKNDLKPENSSLSCHSSKKKNGGDGDHGSTSSASTSSSPSTSTFSLGHRTSSRNLLHQVKELSQQLLARLTDSELRLKNSSQNVEMIKNENIQVQQPNVETLNEPSTKLSTTTPEESKTLENSPEPTAQSNSTLSSPSSPSPSSSSSPNSNTATLENKDSSGSKPEESETEVETEAEADAEADAETAEEDPEFEEEYEPVDPEETENQNQADEDDEEAEGETSTGQATTSNPNTRNQPDLSKGCLALSSEVVLSYGRISSSHEKLHAILYGEHHHIIIGGFLCSLSYTFKSFLIDYNNNNNCISSSNNNSKGTSNDNDNNNNTSGSSTIVNQSYQNSNNNHSRYTPGYNNNTVANGYCIGFYLDDLDPNTFQMEIQDGRIKVAGRRDDIDLSLDIHIAAPVHIEDVIVDHFKANNLLWLKIYF